MSDSPEAKEESLIDNEAIVIDGRIELKHDGNSFFWSNIDLFRKFYLLSAGDLCEQINESLTRYNAPESEKLTESKYWYNVRNVRTYPSRYIYQAIKDFLFISNFDDTYFQIELYDEEIKYTSIARLLRYKYYDKISFSDKSLWPEIFWDNMSYIYSVNPALEKETFGLSRNSFLSQKSQRRLLPASAMKQLAKKVGLPTYPILYLCKFDDWAKHLICNYFLVMNSVTAFLTKPVKEAIFDIEDLNDILNLDTFTQDEIKSTIQGINVLLNYLNSFDFDNYEGVGRKWENPTDSN